MPSSSKCLLFNEFSNSKKKRRKLEEDASRLFISAEIFFLPPLLENHNKNQMNWDIRQRNMNKNNKRKINNMQNGHRNGISLN